MTKINGKATNVPHIFAALNTEERQFYLVVLPTTLQRILCDENAHEIKSLLWMVSCPHPQ